jgi:site-specific recombinase XerD
MNKRLATRTLPVSGRPLPKGAAWLMEESYLLEAGVRSAKTETTYRSALHNFADWLQHFKKEAYTTETPWPLAPDHLTTATLLEYRNWLTARQARSTVTTYTAAVTGYLHFLDGMDMLPEAVQLGKLQRQIARRRVERNQSEAVIDLDIPRQAVPRIIAWYEELPLPSAENDSYNRRLSLLRDRALVQTLYATAARISEVVSLNRRSVDDGRAAYAIIVGKGNKARTLHLRDYARQAIRAYLAERRDTNPALFVAHSRNAATNRLSITSAHNTIKRAVKALDLHESLSAHDFRHFRATQLLREGMPLEVVQEFLGHADISTTRSIYAPVLGVQVVGEWLDNLDVPPHAALPPDPHSPLPDPPSPSLPL